MVLFSDRNHSSESIFSFIQREEEKQEEKENVNYQPAVNYKE